MEKEIMKGIFTTEEIERLCDVNTLERHFGRSLTYEERQLVMSCGKQVLLDKLGLDDEDYKTMQRAFALISAGFTESAQRYDEELDKNNYKALDLFKSLVNDLECIEAERHKVKIGRKEDLGTKITVTDDFTDGGYKEDTDTELNTVFRDAEESTGPFKTPSEWEQAKTKSETESYKLDKVFASETQCKDMGITGDTYEEDDAAWKERYPEQTNSTCTRTGVGEFTTKVDKAIERLDKGCELELDDDILDAVVDRLWNTRNDVSIRIHNNKIKLG